MNCDRFSIQKPSRPIKKSGYWFGFLLFCIAQSTQASFTDSLTVGSAKALALGHAVTADPPGIDSVHFNPAGLAALKGRQLHIKGIIGQFGLEMDMGEYGEYQQNLIDTAKTSPYFQDENGNLNQAGKDYLYDEAHNTHSKAEGPTVMLPGLGMVDLPFAGGIMGGFSFNPPDSPFTFATNVYSPMMNGFHRAEDDPGRYAQQQVAFTVITYFSPSVAYEVSDEFTVGMSVNFNYVGMGMNLPIREPHAAIFFLGSPFIQDNFCNGNPGGNDPASPELNICSTVVSPYEEYARLEFEVENLAVVGYNLGLLWHPTPWMTLGLAYNSSLNAQMEGDFNFPVADNFKTFLVNFQSGLIDGIAGNAQYLGIPLPTADEIQNDPHGKLTVSYELPQHWSTGISIQLTPRWKYNLDIKWTEWSAFSNINLDFGTDVGLLKWGALADAVGTESSNGITANSVRYQLGLQNTTYWGMGTEYQYTDKLALRVGMEYRPSAVPEDKPNAFIPINEGYLYTAGFGYDLEDEAHLDFGVGYFSSKTHYPPCSAQIGNSCNPNNVVYNPYAGQDLSTEVTFILLEVMYQKHF